MGLERMREQTVAGLQYAIEQQKITEVSITLHPCYIVVPFKGEYREYVFVCVSVCLSVFLFVCVFLMQC